MNPTFSCPLYCVVLKKCVHRTSLVVQGLRLWTRKVGGLGLIPGWGTRSHKPQLRVHEPQLKILRAATKTCRAEQTNKYILKKPLPCLKGLKLKQKISIHLATYFLDTCSFTRWSLFPLSLFWVWTGWSSWLLFFFMAMPCSLQGLSSLTRDWSCAPAAEAWSPNHWTARKVPNSWLLMGRTGEGNGTPLQYSCLENPRDGGAWWAAVHGVAQSQTQLKQLSSSSKHWKGPIKPWEEE